MGMHAAFSDETICAVLVRLRPRLGAAGTDPLHDALIIDAKQTAVAPTKGHELVENVTSRHISSPHHLLVRDQPDSFYLRVVLLEPCAEARARCHLDFSEPVASQSPHTSC